MCIFMFNQPLRSSSLHWWSITIFRMQVLIVNQSIGKLSSELMKSHEIRVLPYEVNKGLVGVDFGDGEDELENTVCPAMGKPCFFNSWHGLAKGYYGHQQHVDKGSDLQMVRCNGRSCIQSWQWQRLAYSIFMSDLDFQAQSDFHKLTLTS